MRAPTVRTLFAALTLVLLAGCGGGSSSEADEPATATTAPAPPKDYSLKQLEAALPGAQDVDGGAKVSSACPGDKLCPEPPEGELVYVEIELAPVGAGAVIPDTVGVTAWRYDSAARVENAMTEARDGFERYEGSYDIKDTKDAEGETPGEKGIGKVTETSVGGWEGLLGSRTGSFYFGDDSMQRQQTNLVVANGRTTITVSVGREAAGQPADYADTLARQVLADYLERLG